MGRWFDDFKVEAAAMLGMQAAMAAWGAVALALPGAAHFLFETHPFWGKATLMACAAAGAAIGWRAAAKRSKNKPIER